MTVPNDTDPNTSYSPTFATGQMTSAANVGSGGGVYTWHFSYDLMGRANQQTLQTPWGPANYYPPQVAKAQYTYDSDGKLTSMNYPGNLAGTAAAGAAYQYTYDAVGRATGVNSWDSGNQVWDPVAANGAYNAGGQILGWQEYAYGYAYNMSRSYDPARGWLMNVNANSGYGLNLTYAYNAIGQATGVTDTVNGGQSVTTYSYDNLNRLSGAIANNWTMAWTYDAFGNRQTQTGTPSTGPNAVPTSSLTYNPNTNQIWQGNYSYDANGNMTQMPGPSSTVDSMEYDVFDRLSVLENSNNQTGSSYSYDAFGRRIAKLLPDGSARVYFYSMRGQLLGEYIFTPSGTTGIYPVSLSMPNVYFAGQRVNQWTDRTGSKRKDNTNTNSHYYPYGEEITSTNNDTYKFAQTYRDSDSGLDYANARYYVSSIGRFLTPEPDPLMPAMTPQATNRYNYTLNNPVNFTDPSGQFLSEVCADYSYGYANVIVNGVAMDPYLCDLVGILPEVAPPRTAYPHLTCFFTSWTVGQPLNTVFPPPSGDPLTGWFQPVTLTAAASGGTGSYSYQYNQTATGTLTVSVNVGRANTPKIVNDTVTINNPHDNGAPGDQFSNVMYDTPGVGSTWNQDGISGTVVGFSYQATFTDTISVKSGNQSASCISLITGSSTFTWSLNFTLKNGVLGANPVTPGSTQTP